MADVTDIKGVGPAKADTLAENGYDSVDAIASADPDELSEVDGVGEDRALEFIVEAQNLLEAHEEVEEAYPEDEFDLTPAEVSEELSEDEEDEDDVSPSEDDEAAEDAEEEPDDDADDDPTDGLAESYPLSIDFETQLQYDVFHAALMRHHERVYTSDQSASETMQKLLDFLYQADKESVDYTLTEQEMNTLHVAVTTRRTAYQGENLIDHMDAMVQVVEQVEEARQAYR